MNIPTVTKEDFEADDILATLSVQGREQGYDVLVVSGDRDSIQLVNEDVTLLYPSVRGVSELTRYDTDKVSERYGIEPYQYPEIAALVGETSDNLPGIDKVGEKTAVKWLKQYGSLETILEHADEIKGVVGNNLREQRGNAERNRRLNRLHTDVELPVAPATSSAGRSTRTRCGGLQAAWSSAAARPGAEARGRRGLRLRARGGGRRRRGAAGPRRRSSCSTRSSPSGSTACAPRTRTASASRSRRRAAASSASASPGPPRPSTCRGSRDAPTTRRSSLARRPAAPKVLHDAKTQLKAARRERPRPRRHRVRHAARRLAAAAERAGQDAPRRRRPLPAGAAARGRPEPARAGRRRRRARRRPTPGTCYRVGRTCCGRARREDAGGPHRHRAAHADRCSPRWRRPASPSTRWRSTP